MTDPNDSTSDVVDAIKYGFDLWKEAKDSGLLDRIRGWFLQPETPDPILVLGATGTGKTNFLASLAASAGLVDAIPREDRTIGVEKKKVYIGNRPFVLIDTPGQQALRDARREAYREYDSGGKLKIINVVAYGFHEQRAPHASDAIDESGNPRESFLAQRRVDELAALDEWLTHLGSSRICEWVLTVATKADLWWNERTAVINYYESGEYAKQIVESDQHLRHIVYPYCSVVHRFYGHSILPGTFDDASRIDTDLRLLQQLSKLLSE